MSDASDAPSFVDATLVDADFTNATLRGPVLSGLSVTDGWIVDVDLSGMVRNLTVNGVDVTPYVQAELERRVPERALIRTMATADDHRAAWAAIERRWDATLVRVDALPESAASARVNDEWSFVETLRHLVFAIDIWVQRTILDVEHPYHPLGLPHSGYRGEQATAMGLDLDAAPDLGTALAAWRDRCDIVGRVITDLHNDDLTRVCARTPVPDYSDGGALTVGRCLHVVMDEMIEHREYANRDLDLLAAD